jgi:hypothetical protein
MVCLLSRMLATENHTKKYGSVQKGPSSKAAATWTGGAYGGVREHGQGARTPLACLPSLLRRSSFGYEGRELRRRHGGLFQHSLFVSSEVAFPPPHHFLTTSASKEGE